MRPPEVTDWEWITEAYADYPPTEKNGGFIDRIDVREWIRRWRNRDDEKCRVLEGIGLITWQEGFLCAVVYQVVVHPNHRQKGYANQMIDWLTDHLARKGVVVANFEMLPGPIKERFPQGYINTGMLYKTSSGQWKALRKSTATSGPPTNPK